jgi:AmiR/NasT family two-component response regulator
MGTAERSRSATGGEAAGRRSGPGWRVAVLDEEPSSRVRLVNVAAQVGMKVSIADRPSRIAAARIRQTRCDAVLLAMDSLDGVALEPLTRVGCPVVVCSDDAGPDMVSAAQGIGAMAFLVKPIRTEQLVPTLALAIARFESRSTCVGPWPSARSSSGPRGT